MERESTHAAEAHAAKAQVAEAQVAEAQVAEARVAEARVAEARVVETQVAEAHASKGHLNPGAVGVEFDRFGLGPGLAELVRHVWAVRWDVPAGETRPQRMLTYPAFNVVMQPEGTTLAAPDPKLAVVTLTGRSWAVGILFRPAAGPLLAGDTHPSELLGREVPYPSGHDADAASAVVAAAAVASAMERAVAAASATGAAGASRATGAAGAGGASGAAGAGGAAGGLGEVGRRRVVAALRGWLLPVAGRVDERGRLMNRVGELAETDRGILRSADLAERAGIGVRALERLVAEHVGVTPKWLIECRRLQEAATTLYAQPQTDLSALAAELGYADYPHFSRRYSSLLGETPDETRRASPHRPAG
ncbi:helix-turn-helix domain-containing protein [Herbiconiux sp. P15]|uniref:helix-turn-helix domain-containing protein n=1 Tax=Herbiconiux liukaitaii TaxID=3342799 RepID=UPI0035B9D450